MRESRRNEMVEGLKRWLSWIVGLEVVRRSDGSLKIEIDLGNKEGKNKSQSQRKRKRRGRREAGSQNDYESLTRRSPEGGASANPSRPPRFPADELEPRARGEEKEAERRLTTRLKEKEVVQVRLTTKPRSRCICDWDEEEGRKERGAQRDARRREGEVRRKATHALSLPPASFEPGTMA